MESAEREKHEYEWNYLLVGKLFLTYQKEYRGMSHFNYNGFDNSKLIHSKIFKYLFWRNRDNCDTGMNISGL